MLSCTTFKNELFNFASKQAEMHATIAAAMLNAHLLSYCFAFIIIMWQLDWAHYIAVHFASLSVCVCI